MLFERASCNAARHAAGAGTPCVRDCSICTKLLPIHNTCSHSLRPTLPCWLVAHRRSILLFQWIPLTDGGVLFLRSGHFAGEVLTHHRGIVSIDIGSNGIGDEGACLLADALATGACRSVREIHLDYSGIGATGGHRLLTASANCPQLARVWLHGNDGVPLQTATALHALLDDNLQRFLRGGLTDTEYQHGVRDRLRLRASRCAARHHHLTDQAFSSLSSSLSSPPPVASLADRVARLAVAGFHRRCPAGYGGVSGVSGGKMVVAAFIQESPHGRLRLVALGSGTRFMNAAVVAAEAGGVGVGVGGADTAASSASATAACGNDRRASPVVKDSHAEVLARRALIRCVRCTRGFVFCQVAG